jgi:hypothetical protein
MCSWITAFRKPAVLRKCWSHSLALVIENTCFYGPCPGRCSSRSVTRGGKDSRLLKRCDYLLRQAMDDVQKKRFLNVIHCRKKSTELNCTCPLTLLLVRLSAVKRLLYMEVKSYFSVFSYKQFLTFIIWRNNIYIIFYFALGNVTHSALDFLALWVLLLQYLYLQ